MAEATEGRGGGGGTGGPREGRGTNREGRCSEGEGFSRSIKLPQTMDIALRNIKDAKVCNSTLLVQLPSKESHAFSFQNFGHHRSLPWTLVEA